MRLILLQNNKKYDIKEESSDYPEFLKSVLITNEEYLTIKENEEKGLITFYENGNLVFKENIREKTLTVKKYKNSLLMFCDRYRASEAEVDYLTVEQRIELSVFRDFLRDFSRNCDWELSENSLKLDINSNIPNFIKNDIEKWVI